MVSFHSNCTAISSKCLMSLLAKMLISLCSPTLIYFLFVGTVIVNGKTVITLMGNFISSNHEHPYIPSLFFLLSRGEDWITLVVEKNVCIRTKLQSSLWSW